MNTTASTLSRAVSRKAWRSRRAICVRPPRQRTASSAQQRRRFGLERSSPRIRGSRDNRRAVSPAFPAPPSHENISAWMSQARVPGAARRSASRRGRRSAVPCPPAARASREAAARSRKRADLALPKTRREGRRRRSCDARATGAAQRRLEQPAQLRPRAYMRHGHADAAHPQVHHRQNPAGRVRGTPRPLGETGDGAAAETRRQRLQRRADAALVAASRGESRLRSTPSRSPRRAPARAFFCVPNHRAVAAGAGDREGFGVDVRQHVEVDETCRSHRRHQHVGAAMRKARQRRVRRLDSRAPRRRGRAPASARRSGSGSPAAASKRFVAGPRDGRDPSPSPRLRGWRKSVSSSAAANRGRGWRPDSRGRATRRPDARPPSTCRSRPSRSDARSSAWPLPEAARPSPVYHAGAAPGCAIVSPCIAPRNHAE